MNVTAKGKLGDHDIEAQAINPGNWFGKVWLIEIGCGYSSIFFAVEADHVTDAIDDFIEWERENDKTFLRIDTEDESVANDYGMRLNSGEEMTDRHGNKVVGPGTMTLAGTFVPEDEASCIGEAYIADGGNYADLDNLMIHGQEGSELPWACRYHHPSIKHTPEGIDPRDWDVIDDSQL